MTNIEINIVKADQEEKVTLTDKVQLRTYFKYLSWKKNMGSVHQDF